MYKTIGTFEPKCNCRYHLWSSLRKLQNTFHQIVLIYTLRPIEKYRKMRGEHLKFEFIFPTIDPNDAPDAFIILLSLMFMMIIVERVHIRTNHEI